MSSAEAAPPTGRELGRLGFETGSDIYERARPDYPDPAVAHLRDVAGITSGTRVLDLAAGTGKLTRQLHRGGAVCLAVEPSASMRRVFQRAVPGVAVAGGTAETIPVAGGVVDTVAVGQAFHWFDPSRALPEIVRVLRPRGWLVLIWNERDESDPAMAELVRISQWDRCQPYPMGKDFGAVIDESGLFGPVQRTRYSFSQSLDRTAFVEQVASRSYVQVLPDPERRDLLDGVAAFGATLGDPIAMPYVTDLFCAQVSG
ncbi:MAG TPA: class I SAM-dependent methyltransferase [Acidimicrobiales bacterium]|jgi:SAM-dependent methyltransferase